MGKSGRIRLRDARAIYLLLGECCELGADPVVWRTHMLDRLSRILGAQVAICGTVIPLQDGSGVRVAPENFFDRGWATERDRHLYAQWLHEMPPDIDPLVRRMSATVAATRASITCARRDILSNDHWYGSPFYNEFYRPSKIDDRVESFSWHAASSSIDGVCFIRPDDASPYDQRQRNLLRLFHRDMCRLLGTKLALPQSASVARLSPRLREVLLSLLQGDSENQTALRLGVSRHTIHEHVKRLHRFFDVSSRGELFARSFRYLPALQTFAEPEKR